jgi:outer membrane lipase/esterase
MIAEGASPEPFAGSRAPKQRRSAIVTVHRAQAFRILCLSTLLALALSPARAGELRFTPGLTPYQLSMGEAIDIVCPQLLSAGFATQSSPTGDLTRRCREMRHTANALQGGGTTSFSLGLTTEQLAEALGRLSPEEITTQGTGAIETGSNQARAIGARLGQLRLGATGVSLSGLRLYVDGQSVEPAQLLDTNHAGGASADRGVAGRLGVFVNGIYSFGDKDTTSKEQGFDFDTGGVIAGVDYRFTDDLVAGMALSFSSTDADIDFGLGDVDSRSYGVILYGTYHIGGLYIDAHGSFNWNTYDTRRRIFYANPFEPGGVTDRTAKGDTDGQQFTINLGVGYDFRVARFTLTPYARLEYLNLRIDDFRERGADGLDLEVRSQRVESLQSALGGRVAYAISTPVGVVVPQVHGEWRHEFQNDARNVTAKYAHDPFNTSFAIPTDSPDRNYFALGAGAVAVFKGGLSGFLSYETILGLRDVSHHSFTGGVRVEF